MNVTGEHLDVGETLSDLSNGVLHRFHHKGEATESHDVRLPPSDELYEVFIVFMQCVLIVNGNLKSILFQDGCQIRQSRGWDCGCKAPIGAKSMFVE